jgi:hypothetical protein
MSNSFLTFDPCRTKQLSRFLEASQLEQVQSQMLSEELSRSSTEQKWTQKLGRRQQQIYFIEDYIDGNTPSRLAFFVSRCGVLLVWLGCWNY